MKNMTAAFALIALTLTLATTVLGQTETRNQLGMQGGITSALPTTRIGNMAQTLRGRSVGSFQQWNKAVQPKGISGQGAGDPIPTESFSPNFKAANRQRLTGAEGSEWPRLLPQANRQGASPKGFDKGYLSPGLKPRRRQAKDRMGNFEIQR